MQTITRFLSMVCGRNVRRAGALVAIAALAGSGCATLNSDNSSSYLIVSSLNAASGADPTKLSGILFSDVITNGGLFNDPAQVKFALGMKDATLTPTSANFITVNKYHVEFARVDGGTGVPAPFDGAFTVTVTGTDAQGGFLIVSTAMKEDPLLANLAATGGEIHTVATVTFYGKDQAGRDVSAKATISVNFANWADPS
jgi:hypothetical protein